MWRCPPCAHAPLLQRVEHWSDFVRVHFRKGPGGGETRDTLRKKRGVGGGGGGISDAHIDGTGQAVIMAPVPHPPQPRGCHSRAENADAHGEGLPATPRRRCDLRPQSRARLAGCEREQLNPVGLGVVVPLQQAAGGETQARMGSAVTNLRNSRAPLTSISSLTIFYVHKRCGGGTTSVAAPHAAQQ